MSGSPHLIIWRSRSLARMLLLVSLCILVGAIGTGLGLSSGAQGANSRRALHAQYRLHRGASLDPSRLARILQREQTQARRRHRWLVSKQARVQRAASRMEFHGFSTAAAQKLVSIDYGSTLAEASANPARSISHSGSVVRYLSDYQVIVRTHGKSEIESSTVPLRVNSHGSKRPVSLVLKREGDLFTATNPLESVRIERSLSWWNLHWT